MITLDKIFIAILLVGLFPRLSFAQPVLQEKPRSYDVSIRHKLNQVSIPEVMVPQINRAKLEREDLRFPGERFAAPVHADIRLSEAGTWVELDGGDRIWQLTITASGAHGLGLFYDDFYLPPGARLHVYTPDQKTELGAYTAQNNTRSQRFMTGFLPGQSATIEYYEPAEVKGQGRFRIFRVDQIYKEGYFTDRTLRSNNELGFGAALECHENINCTTGDPYQTEKKAVVRILVVVEEGSGFCTGSLINNTREDGRPLVLSAFHCQDGFTPAFDLWRFDFGYEGTTCSNPESEPNRRSILGCQQLAGRQENDFILLELNHQVPTTFDPYFLGWNRGTAIPSAGIMIHHPRGDVKKISTDDDPVPVFSGRINWNNDVQTPARHHFISFFDIGTFEIGSSGSALIDENQRIIGQLHGGIPTCDSTRAYFGRLALSWEGGGTPQSRLKDWLDPDNTGAMQTNGFIPDAEAGVKLEGMVHTDSGTPITNAQVALIQPDGTALSTITNQMGIFSFANLTSGGNYLISFSKADASLNGVNTLDLIQIQRHILNLVNFTSPYVMLAADVNASGNITTLDLIQIRRVILGVVDGFDAWPDWFFIPVNAGLNNPDNPFEGFNESSYILENLTDDILDFDVIGFKPGDVNNSASQ